MQVGLSLVVLALLAPLLAVSLRVDEGKQAARGSYLSLRVIECFWATGVAVVNGVEINRSVIVGRRIEYARTELGRGEGGYTSDFSAVVVKSGNSKS